MSAAAAKLCQISLKVKENDEQIIWFSIITERDEIKFMARLNIYLNIFAFKSLTVIITVELISKI